MKIKKWLIPLAIIGIIAALWLGGVIPKQIAEIAGTNYVQTHFPEMQFKCTGVEYADVYGDYLISFTAKDGTPYSCVIGPEFLPISMGQGLFAIESDYEEHYKSQANQGLSETQ